MSLVSEWNLNMEKRLTKEAYEKFKQFIEIRGKESYYEIRQIWSTIIACFVTFIILFQAVITFLIGYNKLDFGNYKTFLYIVVGENFFNVIGMGYIVANHLFPNKNRKDAKANQNKIPTTH